MNFGKQHENKHVLKNGCLLFVCCLFVCLFGLVWFGLVWFGLVCLFVCLLCFFSPSTAIITVMGNNLNYTSSKLNFKQSKLVTNLTYRFPIFD